VSAITRTGTLVGIAIVICYTVLYQTILTALQAVEHRLPSRILKK